MLSFNYGSTYFSNKVVLTKFISVCAAWSEIQFEVHHVFVSQKLKKLNEEESLPFGPAESIPPWLLEINIRSSFEFFPLSFLVIQSCAY